MIIRRFRVEDNRDGGLGYNGSAVARLSGWSANEVDDTARLMKNTAPYLIQYARMAMACEFACCLNAHSTEQEIESVIEALDLVHILEDQLTVHREDSELVGINRRAATESVTVEKQLFELLQSALDIHRTTSGAFDITSTPLSKVWGFFRRDGRVPGEVDLRQALGRVGSQHIRLDSQRHTVHFERTGMELNLGGIGKGYALDRCAEVLQQNGTTDFLIHAGKSSVLAHGQRTSPERTEPGWSVGLRHPLRPDVRLLEIHLVDRALGTSGSATQSIRFRGRRFGHIIDPRTGRPAEGVLSATVIGPRAATVDALSTAFYVMGPRGALKYCSDHPELATVLVCPSPQAGSIEIITAGLSDDQWRQLAD